MAKLFRQPYPLLTEEYSVSFLRLASAFRWYISSTAMEASGYVNDYLTTVEFILCHPRPTLSFDTKWRNLSLALTDPIGHKSYYSGVRVKINFPPTQYRDALVYQREFVFSDYVARPHSGYTAYLSIMGVNSYQWETNRITQDVMMEEEVLSRDVNVWLVSVTTPPGQHG